MSDIGKGQFISEAIFHEFKCPKEQKRISALPSKMGQINVVKAL
jgi:hypothetical protein